jgi:16S rRNA (guanine527-N7)-methyltransferase
VDPDFAALTRACHTLGLDLTEDQYALLTRYAELLREWNRRMNLVSRKDVDRVLSYHVIDSLAVAGLVPAGARACDLGSGAGLPGIPLAVSRADVHVVLVESQQKRCQFLGTALRELALANAEVAGGRAEEMPPLECDVVLSRLTGPVRDTLKYTARHLKPGGSVIFYKTSATQDEFLKAARVLAHLGLRLSGQRDVVLPLTGITRRFVIVGSA